MNMQIIGIRITQEKPYYMNQLQSFVEHMQAQHPECIRVEFGKQDLRGVPSICLYNENGCVTQQKHFSTKDAMLGFVVGFNSAKESRNYL